MEKRRKLDLSDLHVESFETVPDLDALRGTVFGRDPSTACTGATCGGYCTDPDCNSGQWDCDSLGCGSNQPDTCYVGCENTCRNTRTSEHGWRSCDHSACWDYTCAGPADSCQGESYPVAC